MMKDIDEIIAAYQDLKIEGGRAEALARLTGDEEKNKRDTLAILKGGFEYQRPTKVPQQDGGLRLFKELPKLPEGENVEHPTYNHYVPDIDEDRRLNRWVEEQQRQPTPLVSKWSLTSAGSSSIYSQHTVCPSGPPSLYYDDSGSSSRTSDVSVAELAPPTTQHYPSKPDSSYGAVPFWSFGTMKKTPSQSLASSRTNSPIRQPNSCANTSIRQLTPRSLTPTGTSQRPHTPSRSPYGSRDASPEPRGRSRNHLHPTDSNIDTAPMLHLLRPVASNSSQLSVTPAVIATVTTGAQEKMMSGRPCKDNNYWGFCKGAWGTREDTTKGLKIISIPEGMYTSIQVWQCRHCLFEGPSVSVSHPTKHHKKETVLDTKIRVSSNGIRYRWAFLAKSHVKKTHYSSGGRNGTGEEAECNFGCVVCSMEGSVTGVYGSVETLMDHIAREHVYTGNMNSMVMTRSKAIVGRTARPEEDWDINIPSQEGLIF